MCLSQAAVAFNLVFHRLFQPHLAGVFVFGQEGIQVAVIVQVGQHHIPAGGIVQVFPLVEVSKGLALAVSQIVQEHRNRQRLTLFQSIGYDHLAENDKLFTPYGDYLTSIIFW
jgi:hypothetical protein